MAGLSRLTAISQWLTICNPAIPFTETPTKESLQTEAAASEQATLSITDTEEAVAVTAATYAADFFVLTAAVNVWAATLFPVAAVKK